MFVAVGMGTPGIHTSLDGITPEERSVVSMVHRIHNRNHGYNNPAINPNGTINSTDNQNGLHSTMTEGANALKIDTPPAEDSLSVNHGDQVDNNETNINDVPMDSLGYLENTEMTNENPELTNQENLEGEFHKEKETEQSSTPKLFSEDEETNYFNQESDYGNQQESLIKENEEEDYEIPAFLRKQKS